MLGSAWKSEYKTRPRAGGFNSHLPTVGILHGIGPPIKLVKGRGIPMYQPVSHVYLIDWRRLHHKWLSFH